MEGQEMVIGPFLLLGAHLTQASELCFQFTKKLEFSYKFEYIFFKIARKIQNISKKIKETKDITWQIRGSSLSASDSM